MPRTKVVFYQDGAGCSPVLDWLSELRHDNRRAYAKCLAKLRLLSEAGHELRRPAADYLRDGLYELRARDGRVQYRLLYFFHGKNVAVLAHALTKEDEVPHVEIERAILRKKNFEKNPGRHTYIEEP